MATVIVFILFFVVILEIRKMKFREEKSSDLPKAMQLVSVELNLISWVLKLTLVTTHVKERSWGGRSSKVCREVIFSYYILTVNDL